MEIILNMQEAARRLGKCSLTVRRWIDSGKLPRVPGQKFRQVYARDIDAYLAARATPKQPTNTIILIADGATREQVLDVLRKAARAFEITRDELVVAAATITSRNQ